MKLRLLLHRLLNPGIYAGALLTIVALVLAYQVRPNYDITIGGPVDSSLLRGFNTSERIAGTDARFRWTTGYSLIVFQDVGHQDLEVTLTMFGGRPPDQEPARVIVKTGERVWLNLASLARDAQDYSFSVPREAVHDGTLTLELSPNAFSTPTDVRELGVGLMRLKVSPSPNPDLFIEPPLQLVLAIALAAALFGLVLSLLGWGVGGVLVGTSLVGGLAAWLVVADRMWLTASRWYWAWPQTLLIGSVVVLILWPLGGWLLRAGGAGWSARQRRILLSVMLLAFAARFAGQLHPLIWMPDVGFHVNRYNIVESGQLLFMTAPAEWAERPTFYLPTVYLFIMPLQWLFEDKFFAIKLFNALISTLGALPLFYLVKRATGDGRAALIATGLYLTVPMAVLPFSWGITPNLFGEFFALCALAIAVGTYPHLRPDRPALYVLVVVLLVTLLSHPGVVQLAGVALTLTAFLWWLLGRRLGHGRVGAVWTVGALFGAFAIAYVVYYGHFAESMITTFRELQAERGTDAADGSLSWIVGGSVEDASLGLFQREVHTRSEWLLWGLKGFWQEAQAYYKVWPIFAAALGYVLIWPRGRSPSRHGAVRSRLALAAVGWLATAVLFAIVGWVLNLYVRYTLFLLPVVAIGAAILLSKLWHGRRSGAVLSLMLVALFAIEAVALWYYRISYAFK